jgi:hypothetical protein
VTISLLALPASRGGGRRPAPARHRAMRRLLTAIAVLLALAPAPAALARDRSDELLVDACRDEHVDGTYSQADFAKALRQIPADTDEYTACRDVVRRAQLAAAAGGRRSGGGSGGGTGGSASGGGSGGGNGGGSGSGGSGSGGGSSGAAAAPAGTTAGPTAAERQALAAAGQRGAQPVELAGQLIKPGAAGLAGRHDLPATVLALVGVLAAAALGGLGWGSWSRVRARRAG